jgi:phage baseplate assembly protein W
MYTFKIDESTNDLKFDGSNNLELVSNEDEVNQSTRILLNTRKGEWFLNEIFGLDFEPFQNKEVDEEEIRLAIFEALEYDERISEITELNVSFNNITRALTVNFIANATTEVITISEVITI